MPTIGKINMNDKAIISLKNVACAFYTRKGRLRLRKVEALKNICLDIFAGETLGIVGSNGAGKSTLLQVLAGVLNPTSGHIHINNDLKCSLLTLNLGLSPELTGRENAILNCMYLGHTRKEAVARLDSIIEFAEIGDFIDEPVRTYSTGMSARLGFAAAMQMESNVMLIDETLGVGDAYFQQKSSKALREKMKTGMATVLVSHSKPTLKKLCTRLAWLKDGKIEMCGNVNEVLDTYEDWVKSSKPCFNKI